MIKNDLKTSLQTALEQTLANHDPIITRSFGRIERIELEIGAFELTAWLKSQTICEKIYWSDRKESFETAGVGVALLLNGSENGNLHQLFQKMRSLLDDGSQNLRFYGGFRFDTECETSPEWRSFGTYRFTIPRFELYNDGKSHRFACNIFLNDESGHSECVEEIMTEFDRIVFDDLSQNSASNKMISRTDQPNKQGWCDTINGALKALSSGKLGKIVLARRSQLNFEQPIDPFDLLFKLKLTNPYAFHFCFQPGSSAAFIGATPELLYSRCGDHIHSEAVAGTRPRGRSPEEDKRLEQDLLQSNKDRYEHLFVHDMVKDSLKNFCSIIESAHEVSVLKLSRVQHLYTRWEGTITSEITDDSILDAMHPTPAVGGHPKDISVKKINELEKFDRGWYAGPVGWISKNASEFAVAIRSGLVEGRTLSLYSGAGIVNGSEAELEWQEIENKMSSFLQILKIID